MILGLKANQLWDWDYLKPLLFNILNESSVRGESPSTGQELAAGAGSAGVNSDRKEALALLLRGFWRGRGYVSRPLKSRAIFKVQS